MAARTDEENVATLFGDIHYFYSSTDVKPRHHRFEKGSYVYLFEHAAKRRCRIEIANQPGTEDQDAFDGFLDQAHVEYSYKKHCMVTLTVADSVDHNEWHLPTYDPKNENKYHYKLHSLDIYFWSQQDALQFVNGVRRVLPAKQVDILDEPAPQPGMSSVIQRLEDVAISDPQYQKKPVSLLPDATHEPPTAETSVTSASLPVSLPLPPPQPAKFFPMAYNPAAPAAPETINYREKTPPPDEDPLNPLAVAVAHDYQKQPFTPAYPPQSQFPLGLASPGIPPNGISSPGLPPHFSAPPQQSGIQRSATMPANVLLVSQGLNGSLGNGAFSGPTAFSPPPLPPPPPPPQPTAQALQQGPANGAPLTQLGGIQSYSYGQPSLGQHSGQDYTIHQQFYRPTESEYKGNKLPQHQAKTETRGRLEENAGRLERGVTGMFKKFEKKFS
ncbi:hypothetical protein C2857_002161 [Epichloe festucae Fl1]|uniref:RNA recognition motif-containing protein n=1 Tax=Epichloe festucae (strain Fl1) TaxID=877507 RepID=A0A7S9KNE3_EPIFF|nr:hypothetical protein C2857_002161 [Epichloe festucae Fl1]